MKEMIKQEGPVTKQLIEIIEEFSQQEIGFTKIIVDNAIIEGNIQGNRAELINERFLKRLLDRVEEKHPELKLERVNLSQKDQYPEKDLHLLEYPYLIVKKVN